MKKLLLVGLLFSIATIHLQAQTEIKLSPVALLFPGLGAGVEYGVSDEFGVDLSGLVVEGGGIVWVSGKYYFNPRQGLDRFHAGVFLGGGTDIGPGIGFLLGTKIVSQSNKVIFELGAGIGRSFDGGFIPYGRLSLGYRIAGR